MSSPMDSCSPDAFKGLKQCMDALAELFGTTRSRFNYPSAELGSIEKGQAFRFPFLWDSHPVENAKWMPVMGEDLERS
jgi:hypothetical protein